MINLLEFNLNQVLAGVYHLGSIEIPALMNSGKIIEYYQSLGAGIILLSALYMTVNIIRRMINKR